MTSTQTSKLDASPLSFSKLDERQLDDGTATSDARSTMTRGESRCNTASIQLARGANFRAQVAAFSASYCRTSATALCIDTTSDRSRLAAIRSVRRCSSALVIIRYSRRWLVAFCAGEAVLTSRELTATQALAKRASVV